MRGHEVLLVLACAVGFAVMALRIWWLDEEERRRRELADAQAMRKWRAFRDAARPEWWQR